ncbi:FKBP-type peptidyl-prolyl cis-trans isomerase [Neolewinella agarilytica]|uniref:Peptidyl-prolyl cis-trans isomerase n=1 Tax=Neolewinella agarilytica TaxID=478744 RepID=A0A1H9L0M3_9BACT|nr:FKBP-type peptidyl-prolyl cis-trans isomerase [Neolewinella agarilytica]SER04868.1 FKBP-type peptidyl-prolyl cis-trans isomerase FkpA [Neolewinella agarilytica]
MRSIIFLLLCCGIFTACESDSGASMEVSPLGNRYELFKDNGSGEPVEIGDYVYFNVSMRTEGDSTLFDTRTAGGPQPVIQAVADGGPEEVSPVEDVLRYMRVGDSAVVRVNIEEFPSKPPGLEADTVLFYDMIVTDILSEEEFAARQEKEQAEANAKREIVKALEGERLEFAAQAVKDYNAGKLDGDMKETASGLKYVIHEEGTGPQAEAGRGVVVQYIGMLTSNGNVFDQSFQRGEGIPFQLGTGRVIPGWDEGIALLKEGAKATFFIPSELGYGAQGTPGGDIPPNSELAFYVELEDVE